MTFSTDLSVFALLISITGLAYPADAQKTVNDYPSLSFKRTVCEGKTLLLKCPKDYTIEVSEAFYGRKDKSTCSENVPEEELTETCQDKNAYLTVRNACDTKNTCSIPVDSDFFKVNPCLAKTFKYARVFYRCNKEEKKEVIKCSIKEEKLVKCPTGQIIVVNQALTRDGGISSNNCDNGTCPTKSVTDLLKSTCDLKTDCPINPDAENIEDVCETEDQTIEIYYTCSECENTGGDDVQCEIWKSQGECEKNPTWMIPYCRKACWECSEPACLNDSPDEKCERWANRAECARNKNWMHSHCRKSCFRCGESVADKDKELGINLVGQDIAPWDEFPYVTQGQQKVFLVGHKFPDRGMLFAFLVYVQNVSPVVLQAWRPSTGETKSYKLVFQKRFVPKPENIGQRTVIYLGEGECGMIGKDDQLAFMLENVTGSIGYNFATDGTTAHFYSFNETKPNLDESIVFDDLGLPFSFGLAAVYDTNVTWYAQHNYACGKPGLEVPPAPTTTAVPISTTQGPVYIRGPRGPKGFKGEEGDAGLPGPRGSTGKWGPEGKRGPGGLEGKDGGQGAQGPQGMTGADGGQGQPGKAGKKGLRGDKGPIGDMGKSGDSGPQGLPGPSGEPGMPGRDGQQAETAEVSSKCKCHPTFHNQWLILGLIIWAVLVTWILVIVATIAICRCRAKGKEEPEVGTTTTGPWVREMKTEEYMDYAQSTINRDGTVSRSTGRRTFELD